jgi:hypothetical protein
MKYSTVEDVIASFSHTILPTVQGEPDYQTIHAIWKVLQANARAIDTHLGGGSLVHLGLIVAAAAYTLVAPTGENGPIQWVNPTAPGRARAVIDEGTATQLIAVRHSWEEAVLTFCTFNTVQQALKKHIITVFGPMYLEILNDDMVGFANITFREMLDHLFLAYGNITAVDLEHNFKQTRKAWDPQQPVETLFKQIQDCADFYETGGMAIGHSQQINVVYTKIFATGNFTSACRRWNKKETGDKTWANFKAHFTAAHHQHNRMQGGSAANSCYHAANAAVEKTEDQIAEATIGALANFETAPATDCVIVATLTEANL